MLPAHKHAGHTPLAVRVAELVEEAVNSIPMSPPTCEVYFNTGYRVAAGEDPSVFVPYLLQQLTIAAPMGLHYPDKSSAGHPQIL